MRKRRKRKLRSCGLCKPHKVGYANRWKPKEEDELKRYEYQMRRSLMKVVK